VAPGHIFFRYMIDAGDAALSVPDLVRRLAP